MISVRLRGQRQWHHQLRSTRSLSTMDALNEERGSLQRTTSASGKNSRRRVVLGSWLRTSEYIWWISYTTLGICCHLLQTNLVQPSSATETYTTSTWKLQNLQRRQYFDMDTSTRSESFIKSHFNNGELYYEYLKHSCTGSLCTYGQTHEWVGGHKALPSSDARCWKASWTTQLGPSVYPWQKRMAIWGMWMISSPGPNCKGCTKAISSEGTSSSGVFIKIGPLDQAETC